MQLNKQTDYAFRVLIYLLALPKGRRTQVNDIVSTYNISKSNVTKIVNRLAQHGFIESTRGRGGGIQLAAEAGARKLGDIVRVMEANLEVVNCAEPACTFNNACKLEHILRQGMASFLDVLDGVRLDELKTPEVIQLLAFKD